MTWSLDLRHLRNLHGDVRTCQGMPPTTPTFLQSSSRLADGSSGRVSALLAAAISSAVKTTEIAHEAGFRDARQKGSAGVRRWSLSCFCCLHS